MRHTRSVSITRTKNDRAAVPPSSNPFRAVISLRLKVMKRLHHARGSSQAKPPITAANIAKRKRSKYGNFNRPPPLANELAMMQFADGGSLDSHIKRVMEAQAKAASGSGGTTVGVSDVYRDEHGGIWWDEDEELEYAHLLNGLDRVKAEGDAERVLWEDFEELSSHLECSSPGTHNSTNSSYDDRRLSSSSSVDSDLDPKYLLPSPESETYPTFASGTPNDHVLDSFRVAGGRMDALSLPPRPYRQAPHLLRSISLGDMQAFEKNGASTRLKMLASDENFRHAKPKGAARRRPVPIKPTSPYYGHSNCLVQSRPAAFPLGALHRETVNLRKEFLEDSFTPSPSSSTTPFTSTTSCSSSLARRVSRKGPPKSSIKKSSSSLNIRGLFARRIS